MPRHNQASNTAPHDPLVDHSPSTLVYRTEAIQTYAGLVADAGTRPTPALVAHDIIIKHWSNIKSRDDKLNYLDRIVYALQLYEIVVSSGRGSGDEDLTAVNENLTRVFELLVPDVEIPDVDGWPLCHSTEQGEQLEVLQASCKRCCR